MVQEECGPQPMNAEHVLANLGSQTKQKGQPMSDSPNPLEGAMNAANLAMAAENMKDAMPGMIRYIRMIGELNAAHFKSLVKCGVPEERAALIVACQPPFSRSGIDPKGNEEDL